MTRDEGHLRPQQSDPNDERLPIIVRADRLREEFNRLSSMVCEYKGIGFGWVDWLDYLSEGCSNWVIVDRERLDEYLKRSMLIPGERTQEYLVRWISYFQHAID